jgi:hypothetical protein
MQILVAALVGQQPAQDLRGQSLGDDDHRDLERYVTPVTEDLRVDLGELVPKLRV